MPSMLPRHRSQPDGAIARAGTHVYTHVPAQAVSYGVRRRHAVDRAGSRGVRPHLLALLDAAGEAAAAPGAAIPCAATQPRSRANAG
jgi:hypothetical protein